MRRLLIPICAGLGLLAAAGPSVAAAADKPSLAARLASCTTGVDDADRAAAFTGSMPASSTSRSMQMRFVLLQRRGTTGAYKALVVPDWGTWVSSQPGRAGFVFTQRIDSLLAPAGYKAAIYFRWRDAKGHVLRMVRRTTRACEQPDLRPDLAFAALDATPLATGGASYVIAVENDGRSSAAPTVVRIAFDGAVQGEATLATLAAGGRGQVTIPAPRCTPGGTVTLSIDADDVVDESDEAGNLVARPCPLK
jgi:hypothetical protein